MVQGHSMRKSDKSSVRYTWLVFQQKVYEMFRRLFLDNHQILQTLAYCPNLTDHKRYIAVFRFYYHSIFDILLLYLSKGSTIVHCWWSYLRDRTPDRTLPWISHCFSKSLITNGFRNFSYWIAFSKGNPERFYKRTWTILSYTCTIVDRSNAYFYSLKINEIDPTFGMKRDKAVTNWPCIDWVV